MNKVYLTGYEQKTINGFISNLRDNGISVLIDVRELPLSRKKGFSKNILKEHLERKGIRYIHLKELGSPKKIRHKLRKDGNYFEFFKKYRTIMRGKHFEIKKLVEMTKYETICLMCFESNCELCHRSILGDELLKINSHLVLQAI